MLSLNQAKWMAQASPAFNKKGRIQRGADADIVIFDAETVNAKATYGAPYKAPIGIDYVIVGGMIIVENGQRLETNFPGKNILGKAKFSDYKQ